MIRGPSLCLLRRAGVAVFALAALAVSLGIVPPPYAGAAQAAMLAALGWVLLAYAAGWAPKRRWNGGRSGQAAG